MEKTTVGVKLTAAQIARIDQLIMDGQYGNTRAAVVRMSVMLFLREGHAAGILAGGRQ